LLLGSAATAGLVAAAAVTGVENDVLPGRIVLNGLLGLGKVDLEPPGGPAGRLQEGRLASVRRGREVRWLLGTPPGLAPAGLPVVLALHGRGGGHRDAFDALSVHRFLAAHVRAGGAPLAVLSMDAGTTYWHPRADGDDPLAMVVDELLPLAAGLGLDVGRLATIGWSMGGFGSLLLARQSARGALGRYRLRAAVAASPAIFASEAATSGGSFDGPDDWRRWGALADEPGTGRLPLHVSCGSDDPFAPTTRRYRARATPEPAGGLGPGRHTSGYWRSLLPDQLAFLARHLA
jgi:dienelactone hydrolase